MTRALIRNTFREIIGTKARFFSIMAIIALGVGFFPQPALPRTM